VYKSRQRKEAKTIMLTQQQEVFGLLNCWLMEQTGHACVIETELHNL